ncbi:MAG: hypothetical protein HZA61_01865 [Candidatus Eisenbacteria bacterium]|uniref:Uncharacterized protein n=1 Tax=Eiseniibacteriota bacterium TaxID=2212470 RepID=A0A933S933_UNCEI|nr:hypothetical protein [Candidatus Eisenbacteria bacterium]
MKKAMTMFVTMLVLACAPALAHAVGVNLGWNECIGGGGATNRNSACASNIGINVLYGSVVPPAGLTKVKSFEIVVDLLTQNPGFTPWWAVRGPGLCRSALQVGGDMNGQPGCADYLRGLAGAGTTTFTKGFAGMNDRARIVTIFVMDSSQVIPMDPAREYYAVRYTVLNVNTVGSSACTGCDEPACLVLNSVNLVQSDGLPSVVVSGAASSDVATWQGGLPGNCALVPVRNRTWGSIKSLYR